MAERTLLVIGAGGFVGAHLAAAAAAGGDLRVLGTARRSGPAGLTCDLLDPASVDRCLSEVGPDLIVNCAGAASVGRSWEQPAATFAANATGVVNLLDAVSAHAPSAHVLCLSSADVYGARQEAELPLREDMELRPVTPYGASKASMEVVCDQFAHARGLRIAVARVFNLIGPGQSPQFAVPGFARRIAVAERDGGEVELALGNAAAVRDFVDVRDGARALLELSRQELQGTFNLCSGRGATIADLVAELAAAAKVPVAVRHDPGLERPADPPALVGDPGRLREATGFEAEVPVATTLADLLDSWRADPAAA
ncbi:MAG TPA: GDP-mannose 4,6-dehydratase [Solirubrobacterales bacterium]|nr:GDP-mannose 4,6-dehydratase [Solirubrobacterales bacterium]